MYSCIQLLLSVAPSYQARITLEQYKLALDAALKCNRLPAKCYNRALWEARDKGGSSLGVFTCYQAERVFLKGCLLFQRSQERWCLSFTSMSERPLPDIVIPLSDIAEIRSGKEAYHLRSLEEADEDMSLAIYSSRYCLELELASIESRNTFVYNCRVLMCFIQQNHKLYRL